MADIVLNADSTAGITPLTVSFSITIVTGSWSTFLWDFGDGHTSTDKDPTHTYTTTGYHTVIVGTTDDYGSTTTVVMPDWIRVGKLSFEADPRTSSTVPFVASFTNTSFAPTGYELTDWDWDFGDVTLHSGDTGPVHSYDTYNKYNVTLSAKITKV